ncbi:restriction endonuclease subunit S [Anaerococcus degeneri]|uniref:Restriction endonuclease subunit S n=1 Tax=Anaerococcus degeneri TaxID=361500 RepID=A0ABS7YVH6_9FIRM|nr:restriction endonuclease subunit S [Anaerococcus degeneri]MBP2015976.1 type I restriction enzyme S subunit [Anaerococcus degeneri]MCA2095722.1 restriction endonuclease subunit S [Anaerococcus degeneri]
MARKMKDSGIEWIGEIPEDWETTRIGSLYSLRNTKVSDIDYPPLSVTMNGILPQLETAAKTNDHNNRKLVKKDDFVINSRSDRRGSCGISKYDGSVSLINIVLSPNETMNPEYYNWVFTNPSFSDEFYKWGNGIVDDLRTTNWSKMKNIDVPHPNLEVQEKITYYLNNKISSIDYLLIKINDEIEKLENYKKSLITEAVTKGLDKNVEMKDSGIEWIGQIPKHWDLIKLKFISDSISKGISPNYVEEHLTPVVNQATFSKGYFDWNLKYCSDKPIGEEVLQKNDVLLATTGGGVLGKTYFFEEDGMFLASTDVAYIRNKNKDIAKLIYYIMSVNYELINGIFAKGSTNQTHLQMDLLANMHIPIPEMRELKEIISKIDEISKIIDETISLKQKQLQSLEEYKKSLIYEYVTGKKEV